MAGDWIKIEKITPHKPEVMALSDILGLSPDDVFGKLFRLWAWADDHTENGNARRVTKAHLDLRIGHTGFADALESVGWMRVKKDSLEFVNFTRHNGQTAKTRALTKNRVEKTRNGSRVTKSLPEKRREEKRKNTPISPFEFPTNLDTPEFKAAWSDWENHRREIKKPLTETSIRQQLAEFSKWGQSRAIAAIRHTVAKGWQGIREPDVPPSGSGEFDHYPTKEEILAASAAGQIRF